VARSLAGVRRQRIERRTVVHQVDIQTHTISYLATGNSDYARQKKESSLALKLTLALEKARGKASSMKGWLPAPERIFKKDPIYLS